VRIGNILGFIVSGIISIVGAFMLSDVLDTMDNSPEKILLSVGLVGAGIVGFILDIVYLFRDSSNSG